MGWERRGRALVYFRCRRLNGRPVRVYLGRGPAAEAAAEADELARLRRRDRVAAWDEAESRARGAAELSAGVAAWLLVVVRSELINAGFHRHRCGAWRKRRERRAG